MSDTSLEAPEALPFVFRLILKGKAIAVSICDSREVKRVYDVQASTWLPDSTLCADPSVSLSSPQGLGGEGRLSSTTRHLPQVTKWLENVGEGKRDVELLLYMDGF